MLTYHINCINEVTAMLRKVGIVAATATTNMLALKAFRPD
jgi:hypothetical protein